MRDRRRSRDLQRSFILRYRQNLANTMDISSTRQPQPVNVKQKNMWLEEVRSAWVPTQALLSLVGGAALALGATASSCLLAASASAAAALPPSLGLVALLAHLAVFGEDLRHDAETRRDRRVFWRSPPFQLLLMLGAAACWLVGRAFGALLSLAAAGD